MNVHPITTPANPSLASPIFDASFDSIESLTSSFASPVVPTLETATVTEVALGNHRNQQYSITAMTTSSGAVAERYAYTAYGQPTILNASGTVLTSSAVGNRYTYTGREWDETLCLHHFRARWMSPLAGRFLGRDPTIYEDGSNVYSYVGGKPIRFTDPSGEKRVWPETPSCGECCCCATSINRRKSDPVQANRTYGITLTIFLNLEYRATKKDMGGYGVDCNLSWYEWSTAAPSYAPGQTKKWLLAEEYSKTVTDSDVFDEWFATKRPTKCPPTKPLVIELTDRPTVSNVDATYTQLSWIAIRLRGGNTYCDPPCPKPNDKYLIIRLEWLGDGRAPHVSFYDSTSVLLPDPGLPHPHF